jgi:Alpha-L-arabinofuranosidase B, catalytic
MFGWFRRPSLAMVIAGLMAGSLTGLRATHSETVKQRPCDIYAAGNTPCVAAHSTVRALYAKYTGALYQVKRASDDTTQNIGMLADGYANVATQDSFCANTTCIITRIYDQSPRHNDLAAPPADISRDQVPMVPTSARRRTRCRSLPAVAKSMASRFRLEWVIATTGHRALRSKQSRKECTWFPPEPISIRVAVSTMAMPRRAATIPAPATWTRSTSVEIWSGQTAATKQRSGWEPTWKTEYSTRTSEAAILLRISAAGHVPSYQHG